MHLTYGAETTFHEIFLLFLSLTSVADCIEPSHDAAKKIARSFILSCQNHGTIKEKLYKAGIKKGSVNLKKKHSSVVFDVFIEHISSAFKFLMQILVPFSSVDNLFRYTRTLLLASFNKN